ncbi:M23 family metallopeptidase [Bacillus sp. BRMEA1]|uniref:M23 family metallopeptidase n=1 Tax=Neobacillus endophyticus TaxID=2738405 RepID=UPI001562ED24|nr:M23 family metallopeptidase [Neobacillus endophyticus]NRD77153.1 M23 family metallopeptidase [Neobacillus endophyticus]
MREEENKRSSQGSKVKRFFKKRWVFPAIYIASAAIILTGVLWYQSSSTNTDKYSYKPGDLSNSKYNQPSVEVNKALENFKMPVKDPGSAVIKMKFYDFNGKPADQESALVFYNNTYQPNTGIDITGKDEKTFDVTASLSGTVTRVDQDSVLGNVVEIEHEKGIVTQYQSIKDIKVKVGDEVKQGDVIAEAGQSLYNEKAGTHVHFEIRKDGVAVNPADYLNKPVSTLAEESVSGDKAKQSTEVPEAKQNQQKIDDSGSGSSTDTPSIDQNSDGSSTDTPSIDKNSDGSSNDQNSDMTDTNTNS